jgi:hypothetical protein
MATAKESLRDRVDRLSEEEAREVLDLIETKESEPGRSPSTKLTRETIRARLAGHPGFRVPPENAPPFRRVQPIDCPGVPASELLIADRR